MQTAFLTDRALVSVSGPDAEHLLQNIITTDLDTLVAGEAKPGALLAPQGKILFDFLISRSGNDGFLLECRADLADDLTRRLILYRLRAKAEITKVNQGLVQVWWQADSSASQSDSSAPGRLRDRRFAEPAGAWRGYGAAVPAAEDNTAAWNAFRIANGIAESGADYTLGDAFPHDVLLDQTGGLGIGKGCYIGQEVVSRMHHRGTARRRVLIATAEGTLPAPGADVVAGGRTIGALGSVAGSTSIVIARIDKVKAAVDDGLPITTGEATLSLSIPGWARFTFPSDASAEGS